MQKSLVCLVLALFSVAVAAEDLPPNSAYAGCYSMHVEKLGQKADVIGIVYPNSTFSLKATGVINVSCFMQTMPAQWGREIQVSPQQYPCVKSAFQNPMVKAMAMRRVPNSLGLRMNVKLAKPLGEIDQELVRYADDCQDPARPKAKKRISDLMAEAEEVDDDVEGEPQGPVEVELLA